MPPGSFTIIMKLTLRLPGKAEDDDAKICILKNILRTNSEALSPPLLSLVPFSLFSLFTSFLSLHLTGGILGVFLKHSLNGS